MMGWQGKTRLRRGNPGAYAQATSYAMLFQAQSYNTLSAIEACAFLHVVTVPSAIYN